MGSNERPQVVADFFRAVARGDYATAASLISELVVAGDTDTAGRLLAKLRETGGVTVTQTAHTVEAGATIVGYTSRH